MGSVSRKYDYLLQVVVKDMDTFHELAIHRIRALANIREMYTGLALKEIQRSTELPL